MLACFEPRPYSNPCNVYATTWEQTMKKEKEREFKEILARISACGENLTEVDLSGFGLLNVDVELLCQVLPGSKITSLDLSWNNIGHGGIVALARVLADTQITGLNLNENEIGVGGAEALAQVLADTQITSLDLCHNQIGVGGAKALAQVLAQTQITSLDLKWNQIGDKGAKALAQVLADTQITGLNLNENEIGVGGAEALAQVLAHTKITSLNLNENEIGIGGAEALAQVLAQTQITSLNLRGNQIGVEGLAALAQVLANTKITSLDLQSNRIGPKGAKALAQVLANTKITDLNLYDNQIGVEGLAALAQAIKASFNITSLQLDETQKEAIDNHLAINKLLNAKNPEDKTLNEFIAELESSALMHINQPKLLDDLSFEKSKRLLLKAMELGSTQAIYLLANLYLNEFKDLEKAAEYYKSACQRGHELSELCLQLISQEEATDILELGELGVRLPRRFSTNTLQRMLAARKENIASIREANMLVSKTGISLAALNDLRNINAPLDVFVADKDYEPAKDGHLHFNQGQTIYMPYCGEDIARNFSALVKEALPQCFIPYNRDRHGNKRADAGFIPYDVFVNNLRRKPREEWSAEEVCNAIIVRLTKPQPGVKSKPYVDMLPANQRGKPFEGYFFSHARATKFTDILQTLNEHFKDQNPAEVFIWIDSICVNQQAWMEMSSDDISKILAINLEQLIIHISEGRLIHFDSEYPTNLTRAWCLLELSACLKAQENTVAQTNICMTSSVQSKVLAQNLMQLLNALDSSKAQCFSPKDKIAIDAQIKNTLTNSDETDISMDLAYARLNNQIKGWLVSKFLPDLNLIAQIKEIALSARQEENKAASAAAAATSQKQPRKSWSITRLLPDFSSTTRTKERRKTSLIQQQQSAASASSQGNSAAMSDSAITAEQAWATRQEQQQQPSGVAARIALFNNMRPKKDQQQSSAASSSSKGNSSVTKTAGPLVNRFRLQNGMKSFLRAV